MLIASIAVASLWTIAECWFYSKRILDRVEGDRLHREKQTVQQT